MKHISLTQDRGIIAVVDAPVPSAPSRGILVRTAYSLVSSGTEMTKVQVGSMPVWEKAWRRPDQVAKVVDAVRNEGPAAALERVRERLAAPQPLGYSLAGFVEAIGHHCSGFRVGDRVACGGTSACHAEYVAVPINLAVDLPSSVTLRDGAFATIGAIAMHSLRTGGVALGDRVLIIGLGLLGQLATRLAVAAGAHVFGIDPRVDRTQLAVDSGAEAAQSSLDEAAAQSVRAWSGGRGADVVLITAGGADNSPLVLAGQGARDRAKVVVVGAVDLNIPREPFYHKELSLVVSRSYGPGRYDPDFEERGYAYPPGFIPWTERRNMEEFLALIADGRLSIEGLVGITLPLDQAPAGYRALSGKNGPAPISLVLEYRSPEDRTTPVAGSQVSEANRRPIVAQASPSSFPPRSLRIGVVGLGNFASATLMPALSATPGATLAVVATASPLKAEAGRKRWGFKAGGTTAAPVWLDRETDVVVIATRHDTHAAFADASLRANRAVFVEKPLALTAADLEKVATTIRATQGRLMVGFNRRFSPAIGWAVERLGADRGGIRFLCRVNAGPLPSGHWLLDPDVGGGRLLGEACHFIDLACHLTASEPIEVLGRDRGAGKGLGTPQDFAVEVTFGNGSTAMIEYVSSGDPSLAKERFEIHRQGMSLVIDDFRKAECHRAGKVTRTKWATRDKGHRAEIRAFLEAVRTGAPTPIPEEESIRSTALTLAAARSIREGRPIRSGEW